MTGREIADELGIDRRTVRRYVVTLQELGIPIEGERGVGGGYRLRPGLPAAAAHARRRRGGGGRVRARRRRATRARDRRRGGRAREDPPRPARTRSAAASRRSSRRSGSRRRPRRRRRSPAAPRSCSPTPSAGVAASASATARSRARSRGASSARSASSSTPGAGTSLRTTTAETTCAPSASTASTTPSSPRRRPSRRRTASTPSRTSGARSRAFPGRGRSRCCSTCRPSRRPSVCRRRSQSWRRKETARSCGCASARSTGWPASSRASAAPSRSGARTSSARASRRLRAAFRIRIERLALRFEYLDAARRIGKYPNLLCIRTKGARFHGKASAAHCRSSRSRGRLDGARAVTGNASTERRLVCGRRPAHSRLVHESGRSSAAERRDGRGRARRPRSTPTARIPASEITPSEIQGAIKANAKLQKKGPKLDLEVGLDRARHAQRRPARHAVLHQADAVVRPRDRGDRGPKCDSGRLHALRRRRRRRRLADEQRAREEAALEAGLGRHPDERDRLDRRRPERPDAARRSTPARARGTRAATARPASASTSRPTRATTGASCPARSPSRTTARSSWVAIQPGDANHILIGTRSGTRGEASNSTQRRRGRYADVAGARRVRVDGRRRVVLARAAGNRSTRSSSTRAIRARCTRRSQAARRAASSARQRAARSARGRRSSRRTASRFTFSPVALPNGKTRIYLGDASGGGQGAQVYRVDDASQPAATLDGVEQRGVDAALEPDRRHARVRGLQLLRHAALRRAVLLRHVDHVAAGPARHGRRRRAHALRGAGTVRVPGRVRSSARARTAARCSCRSTPAPRGTT